MTTTQAHGTVTAILSMMTRQDVAASTIRQSTSRIEYERAYIEAQRLYKDNHIVDNGKVVKHAPKWARRIR